MKTDGEFIAHVRNDAREFLYRYRTVKDEHNSFEDNFLKIK